MSRGVKLDLLSAGSLKQTADFTTLNSGNSAKTADKRNLYLKHAMKSKETNPIFQRRTSSAMTKHRLPKQSK